MKEENFWKTTRGKALIKLGMWLLFFLLVLIMVSFMPKKEINIGNKETENEKVYEFVSYPEMVKELLKENFEFFYKIGDDENEYRFYGKSDGILVQGIRETKDEIYKYVISDGKWLKKIWDETFIIYDLYLESFLDVVFLETFFKSLEEEEYHIEKSEGDRKIIYDLEDGEVVVYTDLKNIERIYVLKDNIGYDLYFKSVGMIEGLEK